MSLAKVKAAGGVFGVHCSLLINILQSLTYAIAIGATVSQSVRKELFGSGGICQRMLCWERLRG